MAIKRYFAKKDNTIIFYNEAKKSKIKEFKKK